VVREILVSDGDEVTEGQVLIKVNPLTLQANLGTIESDLINVLASEARLKAERLNTAIKWPELFNSLSNQPQVAEAKVTQEELFKARRHEYIETMRARQEQLKSLIKEEKNLTTLADEGLVPKANAEQAMRNRLESENLINNFVSTYLKQTETDLAEAQKKREALQLQLEAAKYDEEKASIVAPISGNIMGLKVVTVGGVITVGQVLAEIVPKDSKLVVDVKLPANVIDRVKKDAIVDLHFTAFNSATTPTVPGRLIKVGSDRQLPDKTKVGEPDFEYYSGQVETTPEGLKMLGKLNVQAGMPVDVVIKTGTRSFFSYIMKPISDRVIWAFKS
jgi:protease secretion system membrane fusion protein